MKHLDILKQAFRITWRYRVLWIFGFLLALCGGGGGGGGGSNINLPSDSASEEDFENLGQLLALSDIDPSLIIGAVIAFICLILLLTVLGIVVQAVTRTALMGMVDQIQRTGATTVRDGWHFGWSGRTWRVFLVGLLIGIPIFVVALGLILLALSPLLLILINQDNPAFMVISIILTAFAVLFVIFILIAISVVITPLQEMAWRQTALPQSGVIDSVKQAFGLIKHHFKDVAVIWLLMLGVGIGWVIVSLIVVLPAVLIAVALIAGVPGILVYLLTGSGAAGLITGVPLGLLVLILLLNFAQGLYLIYQSAVWTLVYLELRGTGSVADQPPVNPLSPAEPNLTPEPVA